MPIARRRRLSEAEDNAWLLIFDDIFSGAFDNRRPHGITRYFGLDYEWERTGGLPLRKGQHNRRTYM